MREQVTVTKKFEVSYGHILPNYNGKCGREHGHNAVIEVTFGPPLDYQAYPGIIIDFGDIKTHVGSILNQFIDHHNLNSAEHILQDEDAKAAFEMEDIHTRRIEILDDTPVGVPGTGQIFWSTTAENMCVFLVRKILKSAIGDGLIKIRVWETSNSYAELVVPR